MESNSRQVTVLFFTLSGCLVLAQVLAVSAQQNHTQIIDSITATTTTIAPNASKSQLRVYLVRQVLDNDLDNAIRTAQDEPQADSPQTVVTQSTQSTPNTDPKYQNNSTTQIYIIAVIGVSPAVIGGFMWALKNLKRKCIRDKIASKRPKNIDANNANPFLMNDIAANQMAHKLVERADKLTNDSNTLWYNSYKPSYFVKSRRVYSLEVSRKNLDLIEVLGEGNFGQVWKARATQIGQNKTKSQIVAVKTNKVNTDETDAEDLLKELDIMLQLGSHPNVVKLLGCCTETVPYFLIMEFVSNGKLLSYLRRHRTDKTYYTCSTRSDNPSDHSLSAKDLMCFAYQIAKGMEFISSHGIVHRDLAARNILIDDDKVCKVADFGLSRSIRDKECDQYEQRTGGQMPVRWMSPESLQMGLFSAKSDVWAYGILVWEIVTLGSTPYVGLSAQQVIRYVCDKQIIERPDHCSNELYDLIRTCLTFDNQTRISFTEIKSQLAKLIDMQCSYVDIDLAQFNHTRYYNIICSSGEKV